MDPPLLRPLDPPVDREPAARESCARERQSEGIGSGKECVRTCESESGLKADYDICGMEREEEDRETALYASQSSETRVGGKSRGLALEQLRPLCVGDGRKGRNRIAMDSAETRANGGRARRESPPSRRKRGKGGATPLTVRCRGKVGPAPRGHGWTNQRCDCVIISRLNCLETTV